MRRGFYSTGVMLSSRQGSAVIIECPSCNAKYQYDKNASIGAVEKDQVRPRPQIFEIHNPAFAPREAKFTDSWGNRPREARRDPHHREDRAGARPPSSLRSRRRGAGAAAPHRKRLSLPSRRTDAGTVYRIERPRVTIAARTQTYAHDTEASRQHAASRCAKRAIA